MKFAVSKEATAVRAQYKAPDDGQVDFTPSFWVPQYISQNLRRLIVIDILFVILFIWNSFRRLLHLRLLFALRARSGTAGSGTDQTGHCHRTGNEAGYVSLQPHDVTTRA